MKQSIRTRWFTSGLSLLAALGALAQGTSGLQVNNHNGKTVVLYDGREVWSGTATGTPIGRSSNINGVKHAAVFDGERVLWENAKSAAAALGSVGASPAIDQQKFLEQHQKTVAEQRRLIEEHQRARPGLPGSTASGNRAGGGSCATSRMMNRCS